MPSALQKTTTRFPPRPGKGTITEREARRAASEIQTA
jgi:hypothetical protein